MTEIEGLDGDVLLVFSKAPRPGEVKTRLAEAIGARAAAELYQVLAAEVMRRTQPASREYRRVVFFTPGDARPDMESWMPGETFLAQQGSHLGDRMARAFDEVFRAGARRAVLVGSDVPRLSRQHVVEALSLLDQHDLALGPARDGGYYLVALRQSRPSLFDELAWSTPAVLERTIERAGAAGLRVGLLEALPDIDTLEDVRHEWASVSALIEDARLRAHLEAVLGR
jgi:rSAM/selenodomain-associated transferase 1